MELKPRSRLAEIQQFAIPSNAWTENLERFMNSMGIFDNTKESLYDLLEDIHMGKVQLPDLQRSFTWCNEQILKLIASISQSFPIGAILTIKGHTKVIPDKKATQL